MTARLIALVALVALSLLLAGVLRRREGRVRTVDGSTALSAEDLGARLGGTATLVQFSTSTCAPCRTVRRAVGEVVADRPDVVHVELDATERLDLVRRLGILTTPTVLVLDGTGRLRQRLTGTAGRRRLLEAVTAVSLPAPSRAEVLHD